ncbi:MAG: type IV secretion system protein [Halocynthiibacter sp.]
MNIVSSILGQLDSSIMSVGQIFFQNIAGSIGGIIGVLMALLIIALGINMALGVVQISTRDATQIIVRILLVFLFGLSWTNFNAIYSALSIGSSNLAMSFFSVTGANIGASGGPGLPPTYAAMDGFADQMANTVDGVAAAMGSIFRGVVAALLYGVLGLLMAAFVLIVGFSKIMLAFLLGLAPLAITFTIFEKTKNLFEAWLSALIGYLMYPVAAAAIIGTVIAVANSVFDPNNAASGMGVILPFLVVVFVGIFALKAIPQAVSNLTGQFNLASVAPEALRVASTPIAAPARVAGQSLEARGKNYASGFIDLGKTRAQSKWTRDRRLAQHGHRLRQQMAAMANLRNN